MKRTYAKPEMEMADFRREDAVSDFVGKCELMGNYGTEKIELKQKGMEKKDYVKPVAVEEEFVPNCYCSKCGIQITNNGMRCINPRHNHYDAGYFTSVWIAGAGTTCETIVTNNTPKSNASGGMTIPRGDACLFADGRTEYATNTYRSGGTRYYVPSSYEKPAPSGCYGSYRFDGSAIEEVLS